MRLHKLAHFLITAFLLSFVGSCKKDPCKDVKCQNGGVCTDGQCSCKLPWEGNRCEVDARDKFVGSWRGTENCGGSVETRAFSIAKSVANPIAIIIGDEIRAELKSSTTFDVPSQQIIRQGVAITVSGNGSLNANALVLNLSFSSGGEGITCVYNMTRQ
ncbi:MAG: hypothetical protein ABDH91_08980 [Bacteroidia bacterium]